MTAPAPGSDSASPMTESVVSSRRFSDLRDDPAAILQAIWAGLEWGCQAAAAPWHLGTLGTVTSDGCALRTVVLRAVSSAERWLCCHTDRRSPKIAQVNRCPRVSWLFYDPVERVQLRIQGTASVHLDDAFADARWAASSLDSRRCYLAPLPPGAPTEAGVVNLPPHWRNGPPDPAASEAGRPHFAVLRSTIDELDWYYLHSAGHLRLRWRWSAAGWQAEWIAA